MFRKPFIIVAIIVASSFVFASIAHACSGLAYINFAVQDKAMSVAGSHESPCGDERQAEVCEFVRGALLSTKPAGPNLPGSEKVVSLAPVPLPVQRLLSSLSVVLTSGASFHPVFKLPLSFSYLVLRI
jgi:hypothetical protein